MENKLNYSNLLQELHACTDAQEWAKNKTWKEVYSTCHRGDWLLWLFCTVNPRDLQLLTLAKGHCANTVRHLMRDKRSINAVDVVIAFGEGKATLEELDHAYTGAYAAYAWAAADAAVFAASSTAYAASTAASTAVFDDSITAAAAASTASTAANAAESASTATASAHKENQLLTADICRKYLPIEVWNIHQ